MTTPQQKAFLSSVIHEVRIGHHCVTRVSQATSKWCAFFGGINCSRKKGAFAREKSPGWLRMSEENENRIRESYAWSPRKSPSHGSHELSIAQTKLWRVLCKWLAMKAYKLQLLQVLTLLDTTFAKKCKGEWKKMTSFHVDSFFFRWGYLSVKWNSGSL